MAGFSLGNTLTDNGTVSRGVCTVNDGFLQHVEEYFDIDKTTDLPMDTIVSMNM